MTTNVEWCLVINKIYNIVHTMYMYRWQMTKTSFLLGKQPSLSELLHLKVPQQVGANYLMFGIILLNDQTGSRVNAIDDECRGKSDRIILRILQEWIEGKGIPVMWETLVQTLRDIDLSVLANQIQASKIPVPLVGKRGEREVCS